MNLCSSFEARQRSSPNFSRVIAQGQDKQLNKLQRAGF
jgi:hypothetical protein